MSAVVSVLAASLLGLALGELMRRRGQSPAACVAASALCVLNPMTWEAIHVGEPAVLLGGAACVGAVLAALRGRGLPAAALLGISLATAQWAVIAVLPVLAATPARRMRVLVVALAVAVAAGSVVNVSMEARWPVLLALPLTVLWWSMRRRTPDDVLALLALLFLIHNLPGPFEVHEYAPFLLSLLAWEGLTRRGVPGVSLVFVAVISWASGEPGASVYLLATVPIGAWIAVRLYAPSLRWGRRAWPVPVAREPDAIT